MTSPVVPATCPKSFALRPSTGTRIASNANPSRATPFPIQDAFRRSSAHVPLARGRFTGLPPFAGLCRLAPAYRRVFALSTGLRRLERARPDPFPRALRSKVARASRRSSTSATDPIREHDHRTFRTPPDPTRSPVPSHFASSLATQRLAGGRASSAQPTEDSRLRGRWSRLTPSTSPHRARAPRELRPNPIDSNTSCRGERRAQPEESGCPLVTGVTVYASARPAPLVTASIS